MPLTARDRRVRQGFVTSSDAPAIVGASPYDRTPHDVYLSKVAPLPADAQTSAQAFGHLVEPIALKLLAREKGLELKTNVRPRRHATLDVGATSDALVLGKSGKPVAIAEAKAPGLHAIERWGESEDPEGVPDEVLVQVAVGMAVHRVPRAHVVALIANEPRFYVVEYSEQLAAAVLGACQRFWVDHVVKRVPPPVDGSNGAARMLDGLFPRNRRKLKPAPASAAAFAGMFIEARAQRLEAERREELARQQLQLLIGDGEGFQAETWRATWKRNARGAVDWKSVAEELGASPELLEAHRNEPARVFRCVGVGG